MFAHFGRCRLLVLLVASVALVGGDEDLGDVDVPPTASNQAASVARAAATEANEVAIKSVGVTEHAQTALKVARNALRDARASSGGLSKNQKQLLKDAEGQLRDATLSAEYGKLEQAKWLKAKGHYVSTRETSLKKLEDKMATKTVSLQGDAELESLRGEIQQLRKVLDEKTAVTDVKYMDTKNTVVVEDDTSDAQIRAELSELEAAIKQLEVAEKQHKVAVAAPSHDELKIETEKLRQSIEHLEAQALTQPADNDIEALKIRLRELNKEKEIRIEQRRLQQQVEFARSHQQMKEEAAVRREMEILATKQHILEKELGQRHELQEQELHREIARLQQEVDQLEHEPDTGSLVYEVPPATEVPLSELKSSALSSDEREEVQEVRSAPEDYANSETPVKDTAIDIDTAMPYGELEPFGREDTAQELTESSIRESDEMVDQLERAEVAEEKRAVFRALTRLRGAAITSFDGIARSQTGNIDEYNKIHKWRRTHPLHHLADEESDISKWAFPDNADF